MSELMKVNLVLIRKMKSLWITLPCFFLLEVLSEISDTVYASNKSFIVSFTFAEGVREIVFPIAVFIALFLGREYNFGTVRNRIIAGYSRTKMVISYFLAGCIIAFIWIFAFFATGFVCMLCFGVFFDVADIVLYMVAVLIVGVMEAAIIVLVFTLTNGSTECVILSLAAVTVLWLAGMFLSEKVGSTAAIPEADGMGGVVMIEGEQMPKQGSPEREILETVYVAAPLIQAYGVGDYWGIDLYIVREGRLVRLLVWDAVLLVVLLFAGCVIFTIKKVR